MPCTTILVGKKASNDGSTMISRTDDGFFDTKKTIVVEPKKQPKIYKSVIGNQEIELPDQPLRYTCSPSVNPRHGIWPAAGNNELNVGMTATETISNNERVYGADPLINVSWEAIGTKRKKNVPGGIGEEDIVTLVLPYIHSAREGVLRLGSLLEKYGTYESNGIAFNDENEVWWLETIGGHHWIARRVKDEEYVIMPNQWGLDRFDLDDAFGEQKENLCSADLKEFIEKYHLNTNNHGEFNPRKIFGTHSDLDHIYNTPRAWYIGRYFNRDSYKWEGENADFTPQSDNIPWAMVPDFKISIEDVKYILSTTYQGTEYYAYGNSPKRGIYRPIGIARTGITTIQHIRPDMPEPLKGLEWITYGANPFNVALPFYTNVDKLPKYISETPEDIDTSYFYWQSRLIGALSDPIHSTMIQDIERYQKKVAGKAREIINNYDQKMIETQDYSLMKKANEEICQMVNKESKAILAKALAESSRNMRCNYNRADN